jgi:hypothetical protein
MPESTVLELYSLWAGSSYLALPFPGCLMDQPWWVKHDFAELSALESWHHRIRDKARAGKKWKPFAMDDITG